MPLYYAKDVSDNPLPQNTAEPSVIISDDNPKILGQNKSLFKIPKKLFLPLIVILLIAATGLGVFLFKDKLPFLTTKPKVVVKEVSYTDRLTRFVIKTFEGDIKYKPIIDAIQIATSSKDLTERYTYFKKTFDLVSKAYAKEKNPDFLVVMLDLKNYMKAFPQYTEAETKIN